MKKNETPENNNFNTPSEKLQLNEFEMNSLMDDCEKWLDEMEALDEEQFTVQFDTENPVVLDFTEVLNSDEYKALLKKQNIRDFPRCVFVVSQKENDELFIRLPIEDEHEYNLSKNLFLLSDEIVHPKEEYLKCSGGYIHPSLISLIQKVGIADITTKNAFTLCESFFEAYNTAFVSRHAVIPSVVYNKAA